MRRLLLGAAQLLVCLPLGLVIGAIGLAVLVRDLARKRGNDRAGSRRNRD